MGVPFFEHLLEATHMRAHARTRAHTHTHTHTHLPTFTIMHTTLHIHKIPDLSSCDYSGLFCVLQPSVYTAV